MNTLVEHNLFHRIPTENLIGKEGEKALSQIGFTRQLVSMRHQGCGSLELWNYTLWLRDVIPQDPDGRDRPYHVDLPSLEGTCNLFFLFGYKLMNHALTFHWVVYKNLHISGENKWFECGPL